MRSNSACVTGGSRMPRGVIGTLFISASMPLTFTGGGAFRARLRCRLARGLGATGCVSCSTATSPRASPRANASTMLSIVATIHVRNQHKRVAIIAVESLQNAVEILRAHFAGALRAHFHNGMIRAHYRVFFLRVVAQLVPIGYVIATMRALKTLRGFVHPAAPNHARRLRALQFQTRGQRTRCTAARGPRIKSWQPRVY